MRRPKSFKEQQEVFVDFLSCVILAAGVLGILLTGALHLAGWQEPDEAANVLATSALLAIAGVLLLLPVSYKQKRAILLVAAVVANWLSVAGWERRFVGSGLLLPVPIFLAASIVRPRLVWLVGFSQIALSIAFWFRLYNPYTTIALLFLTALAWFLGRAYETLYEQLQGELDQCASVLDILASAERESAERETRFHARITRRLKRRHYLNLN